MSETLDWLHVIEHHAYITDLINDKYLMSETLDWLHVIDHHA
jgi:predicted lipase